MHGAITAKRKVQQMDWPSNPKRTSQAISVASEAHANKWHAHRKIQQQQGGYYKVRSVALECQRSKWSVMYQRSSRALMGSCFTSTWSRPDLPLHMRIWRWTGRHGRSSLGELTQKYGKSYFYGGTFKSTRRHTGSSLVSPKSVVGCRGGSQYFKGELN